MATTIDAAVAREFKARKMRNQSDATKAAPTAVDPAPSSPSDGCGRP